MCRWRTMYNYLAGLVAIGAKIHGNKLVFRHKDKAYLEEICREAHTALKAECVISKENNTYKLTIKKNNLSNEIISRLEKRQKTPLKSYIGAIIDAKAEITYENDSYVIKIKLNHDIAKQVIKYLNKHKIPHITQTHKNIIFIKTTYLNHLKTKIKTLNPKLKSHLSAKITSRRSAPATPSPPIKGERELGLGTGLGGLRETSPHPPPGGIDRRETAGDGVSVLHPRLKRSDSTHGGCGPPEGKVCGAAVSTGSSSNKLIDYLAGLVFGDGTLYYDSWSRMYYIYIYDKSKEFLEKVAEYITENNDIKIRIRKLKNKNSYELRLSGKKLFTLINNSIEKNLNTPSPQFIRGLLDAEGSLYYDKHHKKYTLEISNTNKELLNKIIHILSQYGFKTYFIRNRRKPPKQDIYKIKIRGDTNIINLLQTFNPLHPRLSIARIQRPPDP